MTTTTTLVDFGVLHGVQDLLDAQEFADLVRFAMVSYDGYVAEMQAHATDPQRLRSAAHKLKGSAGSLGLQRLGALAALIEAHGAPALALHLPQLLQALAQTRAELVRAGLLDASAEAATVPVVASRAAVAEAEIDFQL